MNVVSEHPGISLEALSAALNATVVSMERASSSGNSKVYRVRCDDGAEYAVKLYFQRTVGGLERMDVESSALSLMWRNGMRCIPRLLNCDRDRQLAVFEFIDGREVPSRDVIAEDVEQVVRFAVNLKHSSNAADGRQLPPASEAAFSVDSVAATIETRLRRLIDLREPGTPYEPLSDFLGGEFVPAFNAVRRWARERVGEGGCSRELPHEARTLSPSDFGFHNALRRRDGELVFLDFEYFGWDDPAKMIADFILHPAMDLAPAMKRLFVSRMLDSFSDDLAINSRLETLYPFFGLKWCAIMLNEFIPSNLARRRFAGASLDDVSLRMRQLEKSKTMLRNVMSELDHGGLADV
jgi:Phosphotransferase enzyme family